VADFSVYYYFLILLYETERHGRVVKTPTSYSGSPGLKSQSGDRLSWFFLWFSSVRAGKFCGSTSILGHNRLLPHRFQFIIHLSPFNSTLYNLSHWKSVVKLTTNNNNNIRTSVLSGVCSFLPPLLTTSLLNPVSTYNEEVSVSEVV
jgi:hypothetical protein